MTWSHAVVRAVCPKSRTAVRLVLAAEGWSGHLAGQHVDVRLTAEDGYTAWRSYSVASAPEQQLVSLVVQRVEVGEVSPYLTQDVQRGRPGDPRTRRRALRLEGGIWRDGAAGGSGVVPFLSMLEHHRLSHSSAEVRLLYGLRSPDAAIGAAGLRRAGPRVRMTCVHSRQAPRDRDSATGRLDAAVLHAHVLGPASAPQMFVCGPTGFVESVADLLVGLGHAPASINTERLGDAA